jgi:molybdopterin-guanine dinucleotide biosynthesis protein A
LEWHGSTLLRRVVGLVARGVDGPVVVVRAPGQALPALPANVEVVEDAREGRGPLQGLAAGLAAVEDRVAVAYVSSTDAPLLHPAFVRCVVAALPDEADVALPRARGFSQPLAAAYRTGLRATVEAMLAEGEDRLGDLFDRCRVVRLDEAALLIDPVLAAADPQLDSLVNLNEPADYEAARARPAPLVTLGGAPVHAATLGAAVGAPPGAVTLNGVPVSADPELPLAAGDAIAVAVTLDGA